MCGGEGAISCACFDNPNFCLLMVGQSEGCVCDVALSLQAVESVMHVTSVQVHVTFM